MKEFPDLIRGVASSRQTASNTDDGDGLSLSSFVGFDFGLQFIESFHRVSQELSIFGIPFLFSHF
jgi:hypothetical protein